MTVLQQIRNYILGGACIAAVILMPLVWYILTH